MKKHQKHRRFAAVLLMTVLFVMQGLGASFAEASSETISVLPEDINGASAKEGSVSDPAKAGVVGAVKGDDGGSYDKVRGFFMYETEELLNVFYYSDAFFAGDPKKYDRHLATASLAFAKAAGYLETYKEADATGNTYYNKHAAARQFLADIGCADENIYVNDDMTVKPREDSIGVAIGSKMIRYADGTETGRILIPVAVRGFGYESEWIGNFTLGSVEESYSVNNGYEAKGFSMAAGKVMAEINAYLDNFGLREDYQNGRVSFWITGYSRAGATANITSKRLVEQMNEDGSKAAGSKIYSYTCEAPMGGTDWAEKLPDKTEYYCIHNLINKADLVPLVAPKLMGFKRYGVDHYIPGGMAGEVQKKTETTIRAGYDYPKDLNRQVTITTYSDNSPYLTKTNDYNYMRERMLVQLKAVDPGVEFNDYFHPMAMTLFPIPGYHSSMDIYEEGDYDGNRAEEFLEDFFRFLQEGIFPEAIITPGQRYSPNNVSWMPTQALPSRDFYAEPRFSLTLGGVQYPTVQECIQCLMRLNYSVGLDGITEGAGRLKDLIPVVNINTFLGDVFGLGGVTGDASLANLYLDCIRGWNHIDEKKKIYYINFLWSKLDEAGAFSKYDPAMKEQLKFCWPTLCNLALTFINADDNYNPGKNEWSQGWAKGVNTSLTYLPTFMTFSDYFASCHFHSVNFSWARAYDDWYDDETASYSLAASEPDPPSVYAVSASGKKTDCAAGETFNILVGDQKIYIEDEENVGEAIYYDLIEPGSNTGLAINKLHGGYIDLSPGENGSREYKLTVYEMLYGKKSIVKDYVIDVYSDAHTVTYEANMGAGTKEVQSYTAGEGQQITLYSWNEYVTDWTVLLLDAEGNVIDPDVTDRLGLRPDDGRYKLSFTMPETGTVFPAGYQLKVITHSKARFNSACAIISEAAPKEGKPLAGTIDVTLIDKLGNKVTKTCLIEWQYVYLTLEGYNRYVNVNAGDQAFQDTEYLAYIKVSEDRDAGIYLSSTVGVSIDDETRGELGTPAKVDQNSADGSILMKVWFNKTGKTAGYERPSKEYKLTVHWDDLNTIGTDSLTHEKYPDKIYYVEAGQEIGIWNTWWMPDMQFLYWSSDDIPSVNGRTDEKITIVIPDKEDPADVTLEVTACYAPLVYRFDVSIALPMPGKELPTAVDRLIVSVSDDYIIDPEFVELTWLPEDRKNDTADRQTAYTAVVRLRPKTDENGDYIMVQRYKYDYSLYDFYEKTGEVKGEAIGQPQRVNAVFLYQETVHCVWNGLASEYDIFVKDVYCDKDTNSVYVELWPRQEVVGGSDKEDLSDAEQTGDKSYAFIALLILSLVSMAASGGVLRRKKR